MKTSGAIRPLLQRIGLDPKEIEVYLALLPLKMARAAAIAKAAKQSRSHTYLILRSLEGKGLVSEIERGKVIHFIAEDPKRLLSYVQDREREFKDLQPLVSSIVPMLSSLTGSLPGKPRVTMLQGLEGAKQVYRDILTEEIHGIFNPESMEKAFGQNLVTALFGKDAQLTGKDLLVDNAKSRRYLREVHPHERYEVRLLPKGMTFATDTIVFSDTLVIWAYDDEQTIIRIENANIADAFRSWHEALWSMAKTLN